MTTTETKYKTQLSIFKTSMIGLAVLLGANVLGYLAHMVYSYWR